MSPSGRMTFGFTPFWRGGVSYLAFYNYGLIGSGDWSGLGWIGVDWGGVLMSCIWQYSREKAEGELTISSSLSLVLTSSVLDIV